jgi:2-polyprenyl-3-methyl-5-hydroxy-6-metoxy-1,4-benzoquinol methylase
LAKRADVSSWEWEDLEYWDRHYLEDLQYFHQHGTWVDRDYGMFRTWERLDIIAEGVDRGYLRAGGTVLEIGAGLGQTMQRLAPGSRHQYVYVATDMSHHALLGNRLRRDPSHRGFEILAAGDNLPVRDGFAQLITSWGVLHHLPTKESTLRTIMPKVRLGGALMLAEAIHRPQPLGGVFSEKTPNSMHDEQVDRRGLLAELHEAGTIRYLSLQYSSFYGLVTGHRLQKFVRRSYPLWRAIRAIDRWLCRHGGGVVPSLQPGMCLALVERDSSERTVGVS